MTANDPTHPNGENVSEESVSEKVLREIVEAQIDCAGDMLVMATREDNDLEELRQEIAEAEALLMHMRRLLDERDGSLYVDLVNGPSGEMRK